MHNSVGKSTITLTTMGGLATFAGQDNIPSGVSPRCHDVDFSIGSVVSRKGTKGVYSFSGNDITQAGSEVTNPASSWTNPDNSVSTSSYASASGMAVEPLLITEFAFDVSLPVIGITVNANGNCNAPATMTAQLLQGGIAVGVSRTVDCPVASFGGSLDLWGITPSANDVGFGVQISADSTFSGAAFTLNSVTITLHLALSSSNFQYVKSFVSSDGTIRTLAIDSSGEWWVENATTNPGVLSPLLSGLPVNGYAKSVTADDREYVAFSDLHTGNDIPRQYTGQWIDRITQVAPGAPPFFTPQASASDDFAISTITQPAAVSTGGFSYFLQSTGPGSSQPGNTITFYYADSTISGPDSDLVTAFNSGQAVFMYVSFTGNPHPFGPQVIQVTSIGLAQPPGQPRSFYYFTFNVNTIAYAYDAGNGQPSYSANFQRTLATMTAAEPVPGLIVGSQATITGASVANYDSTWTITQTLNSGALTITQTSVTSGVATYSYSVSTGAVPTVGELVTITGTTNANGLLNVTNAAIQAVSGGSTGTFTVNVTAPDTSAAAESGQATTAGTEFTFDPGQALVGTSTDPIYGTSTGGDIVFAGSAQLISPGTRQGVVWFVTRNGAETPCSTPIIFTIPTNTSTLVSSQIPIGPPNTVYRQVAITEPGQDGVPGGDFYTIDNPITYTVNGVNYISTSFQIPNNTDTSLSLTFRDSDLLAGRRIDVQGEDLFNQIEIGSPAWIQSYASRTFYGLTQTKVQNFANLSFDGGYLPATTLIPLGWTAPDVYGQLLVSPIFGNSYYIKNTSGSTLQYAGTITQSAYRDYYGVPIIQPNIDYSFRITARIPSGNLSGNLVVELSIDGITAQSSIPIVFSDLSATMQTITRDFGNPFTVVPTTLQLKVYADNLGAGADVEVDRVEIFPTSQPVNNTELLVSYVDDPEGVDNVTGSLDTDSENTQPCYGAVVMYDLLYLLKDKSMYYTQDSSGDEPDAWTVHEVSNKAGACGVNAYDSGEEWISMANRNGAYVFTGGEPIKISQEIQQLWDSINWNAGQSIWHRNDVQTRKLYYGIPLPTPNMWLPDAPVNAAPGYPNVILMCSYEGQNSGSQVIGADPIYATQFGNLDSADMRRKWTLWQIPSPYADFILQPNGEDVPLYIGNGIENSKIYTLTETNDDGVMIPWRYTTYGFGNDTDEKNYPALMNGRKRWSMWRALIKGAGVCVVKFLQGSLSALVSSQNTYSITLDQTGDLRGSAANATGYLVFMEFTAGAIDSTLDLSMLKLTGTKDIYNSDYVRD